MSFNINFYETLVEGMLLSEPLTNFIMYPE